MFDPDLFVTLSQAEVENTNLFPFPFGMHITFAVIGLLFFVYRFFTDKKPYQLLMAVGIPFSLTLWASESRTWFYIVGAIEFAIIVLAFISTFIFKNKNGENAPVKAAAPADDDDDDDDDEE